MTSLVEQYSRSRRLLRRSALAAVAGILAIGIVWLPSQEGPVQLALKIGCTIALWAIVLIELAVTGHRVRQARTAERRAEHTRQLLAEALDVLPQAIAVFDPADRPVLVNQRYAELQGSLSPFSGGADTAGDGERSLPDGRWIRMDGHRTRNGYRIAVSSDVTELKRQKAELARRSRLLEMTLNASDRGVCIWGADGRLTMSNAQAARLLDLPADLLTAGCPFDEFQAFLATRGEEALAGAAEPAPSESPRIPVRYEYVRPDGHVLDVFGAGMPDGGRMVCYSDVTAYRRVERDLREAEERFRRLASATREGVLVHDGNVIIDANDAALVLLDRPLADLIGRSAERLIAPADYAALRETFECGRMQHREAWFLRPDGSRILCEVSQRLVPQSGRFAGILTFHDITGDRWVEDQLRAARQRAETERRAGSDFLAVVGKGLRTSLRGVLDVLRQLSEGQLAADQRDRVQAVRKSVQTMSATLAEVEDLARIESGARQIADNDFNLIDLVESVVAPQAAQATAKGIDLVSSVAADVPRSVRGDAGRLRQVLTTLIGNAVKFTEQGGVSLSLTASRAEGGAMTELRFDVADTGIGITAANHARILDGAAGNGMALAIARRLIELMGGTIGFDSAPGIGTHFWFVVTLECRTEDGDGGHDFSGLRVLLIEGNGASRKALTRQLVSWNAAVQAVPDGAAALAAATLIPAASATGEGTVRPTPFDVALIDSHDADLPVTALARRLRDAGIVHLILLCPPGHPVEWHHLEAAGFSSVLRKPARQAMLAAALGGERVIELGLPDAAHADRAGPGWDGFGDPGKDDAPKATDDARRLLLVEDSVTNQLVAGTLLKIAGFRVEVASNGMEAIAAVKSKPFDLVLMDIAMPEMDGIAATRAIRALPAPAGRIPIIAMTANAMVGDRERFLEAGMNDYVPKPIERPYLLATIARWLPAAPAVVRPQGSASDQGTAAGAASPLDMALDIGVLEQLRHDLDDIVLPDLIEAFLAEARLRSRRMADAAAVGDMTVIEREAHTLKSSASTFGAARLAEAVKTLERTCRSEEPAETNLLCGEILALVEEAAGAYRALGVVAAGDAVESGTQDRQT
ncbi:PAS domain S-box-containing protein [Skermanella aerolata]|uniref:PAS-domain containing protein n=1 Tax=Skermanella aerolata TaxID=393310 RepID=UPI003D220929